MRIQTKLNTMMLLVAVVPLCFTIGAIYLGSKSTVQEAGESASEIMKEQALGHLEGIAAGKAYAIERYFESIRSQIITFSQNRMIIEAMRELRPAFSAMRQEDSVSQEDLTRMRASITRFYHEDFGNEYALQNGYQHQHMTSLLSNLDVDSVVAQHAYIAANPHPLKSKEKLDRAEGNARYHQLHERFHPTIRRYLEEFGYYDIFLIDPVTGDIIYSVYKELDFSTSLLSGPYSNTNFAKVFKQANQLQDQDAVVFADFENYTPSYEAAASFIASPIFLEDKKIGIAIFQMPLKRISQITSNRDGLGKTGETLLVGPDYLMRSDSFRDPTNRSVAASFRYPDQGQVNTPSSAAALGGKKGAHFSTNYANIPVLSAYTPVRIVDTHWALLTEIEAEEALGALTNLQTRTDQSAKRLIHLLTTILLIACATIILLSRRFAKSIAKPIEDTAEALTSMARGDLRKRLAVSDQDELGEMASAFNQATDNLVESVKAIVDKSQLLQNQSDALTTVSRQLREAAKTTTVEATDGSSASETIRDQLSSIARSTHRLIGGVTEISNHSNNAKEIASKAVSLSEKTSQAISRLDKSSYEIGNVTEVISAIAEQTNLLALNATIEAARAGEAGKGFAVVASEVKGLAQQTHDGTRSINNKIESIQNDTTESVEAIQSIAEVILEIDQLQKSITDSVLHQKATSELLGTNVADAAQHSDQIAQRMQEVTWAAARNEASAKHTSDSASTLTKIANELNHLVAGFKTE